VYAENIQTFPVKITLFRFDEELGPLYSRYDDRRRPRRGAPAAVQPPCPAVLEVLAKFSHFVVLTNHSFLGEALRRGTIADLTILRSS
jgi:hypothetical protein